MNLQKTIGGLSLRFWLLVGNFAGNVLLLHGAVSYVTDGARVSEMVAGGVVTAGCILLLAVPDR